MTDADVGWEDYLAGHRMAVDGEFDDRIRESSLNRQQWGLLMTAIEFEVEDAGDPDRARLVADTSKLDHVLPAMQERAGGSMMGGAGAAGPAGGGPAPGAGGGSGAGPGEAGDSGADDGGSGGFIDRIKRAVVGSGGGDDGAALKGEAERLAEEYADRLQARLEERDQWAEIRALASDDAASDDGASAAN